jgi:hypothetical protein
MCALRARGLWHFPAGILGKVRSMYMLKNNVYQGAEDKRNFVMFS